MPAHRLARSAYLGCLIVGFGCTADAPANEAGGVPAGVAAPVEIASPAAPGSGMPYVHAGRDGVVRMSWLEPAATGHALRFAELVNGTWSAPRTIASSAEWFVNWADFPSLIALPDGTLAAHWLAREGPGTYAYGVRVALSRDGGASWSEPVTPHRDGTLTEHGFVTLYPAAGGGVSAVWLDGRNMEDAQHGESEELGADMTLRATTISLDGMAGEELLVDDRTCECCQTDVALADAGPVLVYRDRSPDEIRDIGIATFRDGRWSEPRVLHDDGWRIMACPVNGPAAAAHGDHVAVAWYTAAQDTPRVRVAFSADGGDTFSPPVRADDGDPEGRVDILMLDDGHALLAWLERGEPSTIRVRRVGGGAAGPSTVVGVTSAARASGFPRMARSGNVVVVGWTVSGDAGGVRTAAVRLDDDR